MNIHNFKYFLKEGFKNLWINRVMSAASMLVMTCCMILTGGAVLLSYNVNAALKSVENKNSLTFLIWMPFIYFSWLIVLASTSNIILNKNDDRGDVLLC